MEYKRIWELKQSTEPNVLEMYIYGDIKPNGYDYWTDQVIESETSAEHFRQELAKYQNVSEIRLYVNSFGGSVFEAMAIRNQLKRHPAKVIGYVDGFACSAASFILTACDEVKMYSNTMQMIHDALNYVFGNSKQLRKAADDLDQIMVGNRQAYLEKANGKLDEAQLIKMLEEDTWLTASECLAFGLADEVIDSQIDMQKAQDMLEQRNKTLMQQINYSKKLVALANELTQSFKPIQLETEPIPSEPKPEPIQENKFINLISAIMR